MPKEEKLGVDVGGVIINRVPKETIGSFLKEDYLKPKNIITDSFSALKQIVQERFGNNVFLISRGGAILQIKTRYCLNYHNFYKRTGINSHNTIFCLNRKDKAVICQELGITHFIDDRLGNLCHAINKVEHLYLFRPEQEEVRQFAKYLKYVHQVNNWKEVLECILQ